VVWSVVVISAGNDNQIAPSASINQAAWRMEKAAMGSFSGLKWPIVRQVSRWWQSPRRLADNFALCGGAGPPWNL